MVRSLKPFDYLEPRTVEEASRLLSTHYTDAKILAGGVDLLDKMRRRLIEPKYVVSLGGISGLDYIISNGETNLRFGALTTLRSLESSLTIQRNYVCLWEAVKQIASNQVKNMGTVVGNICVATPASDVTTALYALGAQLKISCSKSEIIIPIENFFIGVNKTILQPGELITEVLLPGPSPTSSSFMRLGRTLSDITKIGIAVAIILTNNICKEAKIALGAVAPTVFRAKGAEATLIGQELGPNTIEKAAELAAKEAKPITDLRSTAEYRKEMVKILTRRAIEKTLKRVNV